jgi:hypothetical protein
MSPSQDLRLPEAALLSRLAVSDNGFVLDPVSGSSFTVNPTGLALLRTFAHHRTLPEVIAAIEKDFQAGAAELERDVVEFASLLYESVKP